MEVVKNCFSSVSAVNDEFTRFSIFPSFFPLVDVVKYYSEYALSNWPDVEFASDQVSDVLSALDELRGSDVYAGPFSQMLHRLVRGGVPSKWSGDICMVNGVPGGGKSSLVCSLPVKNTVVVVPFSSLKEDYRKCGYRCFTPVSAVSNVPKLDILVFDEYTGLCKFLVFVIILCVQPKCVCFVGDPNQCWLMNKEGISMKEFSEGLVVNYFLAVNHRNPCFDVARIASVFEPRMLADCYGGCNCTPMEIVSIGEGMSVEFDGIQVLCFSRKTEQLLTSLGINCMTVRSAMGKTFDRVALFFYGDKDRYVARDASLRYVALTRHRTSLVVYSDLGVDDTRGFLFSSGEDNRAQWFNSDFTYGESFYGQIEELFSILNF